MSNLAVSNQDPTLEMQEDLVKAWDDGDTEKFTQLITELRKKVAAHGRDQKPSRSTPSNSPRH